jgi:uncharacterized repeat protein (TIGR03803 family)
MQFSSARFQCRLLTAVLLLPFALSAPAAATETVLHTFAGAPSDGANPAGGLIADNAGNLYGTTPVGGTFGAGTVYEVPAIAGTSDTVLYNFTGGSDGGAPLSTLVLDAAGNLWGTTELGGTATAQCPEGCGVVFQLTPSAGSYTESVVYAFTGGIDGGMPMAGLTMDPSGNFYGTASCGGASSSCPGGYGVVFEIPAGGGFTVLHSFTGSDGAVPVAPVIFNSGVLYGTTEFGGGKGVGDTCPNSTGCGVVFALSASGGSVTLLHRFGGASDGGEPLSPVVLNSSTGTLYGTASCGGLTVSCASSGNGVVFHVGVTGSGFGTPLSFKGSNGARPVAGLVFNKAKTYLYGTTEFGGVTTGSCATLGCGVVFKVTLSGTETILYKFAGGTHGANPVAGLFLATSVDDSRFPPQRGGCTGACGTAFSGGDSGGDGVVYESTP